MKIDRKQLVCRHNPVLTRPEYTSPLSVGNGELAFTADVTGLQSFPEPYEQAHTPLCTISQWGWHTTPSGHVPEYTQADVSETSYRFHDRTVTYASERQQGNEAVYDWLRQNPHRFHLGRIGFALQGQPLSSEWLSHIQQELHLYDGILESRFCLRGLPIRVTTACAPDSDTLLFSVSCDSDLPQALSIRFSFPYGSPDISGADWDSPERHSTQILQQSGQQLLLKRTLDKTVYFVCVTAQPCAHFKQIAPHEIEMNPASGCSCFQFSVQLCQSQETCAVPCDSFENQLRSCVAWWNDFWETGGALSLSGSDDPRAPELERRLVLSQYLLAVNSRGSTPPQETGLFCNSWYGKFHLEMMLWHWGAFPLWNRGILLKKGLRWYSEHLPQAKANAAKNGYPGARWPKMVANTGIDSPSSIATLLVWQQPHILYLLELLYRSAPSRELLHSYWEVVRETADFMAGFAVHDPQRNIYELLPPLIPAQETYTPQTVRNPAFETAYWPFGLKIAIEWAQRLGQTVPPAWEAVASKMAPVPQENGLYIAHANCPNTFQDFHHDHPSMLAAFGLLPGMDIQPQTMRATLEKAEACWDYESLWGWDFAMMAMTAVRLNQPEKALDLLLCDTPKNQYQKSGQNFQLLRTDLPSYLPGNGGLLIAAAMMAAGYDGCTTSLPGFPKNGRWHITYENLNPLP